MNSSKLLPLGALRVHTVIKFKKPGDWFKAAPYLRATQEATLKGDGYLEGEFFLKEDDPEETATEVHLFMVWRSEADFMAHQNAPHCKEFHEKAKDLVESVVETKFKQVLR